MDSTRSPHDPSAYLESLMQAGQESFRQFDDAMAAAMGLADKPAERETSPLVAAANLQRDAVLQVWKFWNTTLVKALGVESGWKRCSRNRTSSSGTFLPTPRFWDSLCLRTFSARRFSRDRPWSASARPYSAAAGDGRDYSGRLRPICSWWRV